MRYALPALLLTSALARADANPPLLLQRPAVSATQVAFAYADDCGWSIGAAGTPAA